MTWRERVATLREKRWGRVPIQVRRPIDSAAVPTTVPHLRAPASTRHRLVRYGLVTAVNVFLGLAILIFLHGFLGWHGVAAAVTAVVASAVPCFVLNRRFVWSRAGQVRIRAEVVPFALFTLVGLLASSGLVFWASRRYSSEIMVYVAHQSAFGVLWVLRFLLFDRVLWSGRPAAIVRALPFRPLRTAPVVDDLAA